MYDYKLSVFILIIACSFDYYYFLYFITGLARGFYIYTITKVGPDVYITKKFVDTSISSHFFVLTSIPFCPFGVRT